MTDRELLELAAKAAGLDGRWDEHNQGVLYGYESGLCVWNPLRLDSDALRLSIDLCIDIHQRVMDPRVIAIAPLQKPVIVSCRDTPRDVATRRAIVLAAAEIEKGMA